MAVGSVKEEKLLLRARLKRLKCPHLTKLLICTCKACEIPYAPTLFQLEEYCKSKQHEKCPFYLQMREYEVTALVP